MDKKKIEFQISFTQDWILSKREDDDLPPKVVLKKISEKFKLKNGLSKVANCSGVIELSDDISGENIIAEIESIINNTYAIDKESKVYSVEINDYKESSETKEKETKSNDTAVEQPEGKSELELSQKDSEDITNIINKLIGASEFKALAEETVKMAPSLKDNNIVDSFTSRAYIVSINEGYGLTTYLNSFADLIEQLGLFKFKSKTKCVETVLMPFDTRNSDDAFSVAKGYFNNSSNGKIVCIDIAEWMNKLTDKLFRDFLKLIDDHSGENIVFFRIPFVEQNIVMEIQQAINDLLYVKSISIPPFNSSELKMCADTIIKNKGYTMEDEAWIVFDTRIAIEKSDGRFYGINTINKVIREMLFNKLISNVNNNTNDKVISKDDIISLVDNNELSFMSGMEQLEELVGIDSVRVKVEEIIAQIETALKNKSMESPCIHMRFVGNPGTGKTTVARIIGTILKEKGILRNGSFFEYSGRDLCGRFVGETAPKTSAICRDAYGSVLFIDEAYSLYRDDHIGNVDYGREALDTLVAEMENHRNDLVVIMAGYPAEMDNLMDGNVGLKSRMPFLIEFPNYSREQLAEIFLLMASKSFKYDEAFATQVNSYFDSLSDKMINSKEFSNARFVRNLFERTWCKAALRCQMSEATCDTLTAEDFNLASIDKEFQNIVEVEKRPMGFI
jgi:AAA+ superfamily predicted ATPase